MQFHAPTNQFTIKPSDLQRASHSRRWAIRHIREASDLDPKGYHRSGPMDNPEFAETGILDAAKALGIDLGADRAGMLDVSNENQPPRP